MPFRGWWMFAGEELANSSRVSDHMRVRPPTVDADQNVQPLVEGPPHLYGRSEPFGPAAPPHSYEVPATLLVDPLPHTYEPSTFGASFSGADGGTMCGCSSLRIGYDDSWDGLPLWLGSSGRYKPDDSPWYDPNRPASAEFVGVWPMQVEGLDSLPTDMDVDSTVCGGGVAGPLSTPAREVSFDALVVGCTNAGARYGLSWLSRTLRQGGRAGAQLEYLDAHPQATDEDADSLTRRLQRVVLSDNPTVEDRSGLGGGNEHRQASVLRVSFTMTALDPYVWGRPETVAPDWSTETVGTEWGHAPDCDDPASCPGVPSVLSTECLVRPLDMKVAPIPACGGCMPLCELDRHVWEMDPPVDGEAVGVTLTVTNTGSEPLSLSGHLRECGMEDPCDEQYPFAVNGLPEGETVVLDAPSGRAHGMRGGEKVRQVGIVSTPSGAPWAPPVIDTAFCWELVADTVEDSMFDIAVTFQERFS